jgi:lysophospholipase L1-like esterase
MGVCRIPLDLRAKLNASAQASAIQASGCEIRFKMVGEYAAVKLAMVGSPAIAEVYCGPFLIGWHIVDTSPTEIVVTPPERLDVLREMARDRDLPFAPDLFRIVLPWRPPVKILAIEGELAPPDPDQTPATTYLAYGSSITHGASGLRALGGYAMRTAQHLGVDGINLGFGGGAHCEPAMADYIAGRTDWDFATLELGINMVSWLETPVFAERVSYFIPAIAKAHPDQWIFCIDMFPFYMDFDPKSERNHAYRAVVREVVEALDYPKVLHLDGRDLLRDATGLTADVVHPAPQGMEAIAINLATRIQRTMAAGVDKAAHARGRASGAPAPDIQSTGGALL